MDGARLRSVPMMSKTDARVIVPAAWAGDPVCRAKLVADIRRGARMIGCESNRGAGPAPNQRLLVPLTPALFGWMYGCAALGCMQMLFVRTRETPGLTTPKQPFWWPAVYSPASTTVLL